jgi:DNA/RNA-binding domain of Phe-tRNA-synthetase-like protein
VNVAPALGKGPRVIRFDLEHPTLRLGLVRAENVFCAPSEPALLAAMSDAEAQLRAKPETFSETTRGAIRDVLRKGGYKPTGRGKPASEFLLGVALEAGMPRVNNLVDINNLTSLRHALPISMFDCDLLGTELTVRFGRPQERYVFNAAGQSMDIAGLPVICRGPAAEPAGNAVKDSMLCKVRPQTRRVLAVIYANRTLPEHALSTACEELERLLKEHAGASETSRELCPA